jgi:hypothetical protein
MRYCKCKNPKPDSEYVDICGYCGDKLRDMEESHRDHYYCPFCLAMFEEECICGESNEEE